MADGDLVGARLEELSPDIALHRVETRADFAHALEESGKSWDIILADYNVPSFDGRESLAIARQLAPETPFVFVSGAIGEELAIELFATGATDYVLKDRLDRLVPSVQRALRDTEARRERSRAELALRESQATLETLMSNLPGMAFRCEPSEPWRFSYCSAGARELAGYACEELIGSSIGLAGLVHPDDRALLAESLTGPGEAQRTVRYRIRRKDGTECWIWDRSVRIYDAHGGLTRIDGFATDVTQQVEAERETQRRAEFEQQLIGIVSHDLRNPLNVIMLAASTAVRSENVSERVTRLLLKIQSAGDRAARLIGDLLDFTQARLGAGIVISPRRVNLREIVEQIVDEAETTHPGRHVEAHYLGDLSGEWDADRLAQALGNLLVNALKHGTPTSAVTVRVSRESEEIEISVHNQGSPIPDELQARLFQPMQRGTTAFDRTTRSVGLGLYIVDQIVRRHGGEIVVESTADTGTTFRIRLPVIATPASTIRKD